MFLSWGGGGGGVGGQGSLGLGVPSASWAIDSEPIRARGIIVKYSTWISLHAATYDIYIKKFSHEECY